jgi:hypothetical protein
VLRRHNVAVTRAETAGYFLGQPYSFRVLARRALRGTDGSSL